MNEAAVRAQNLVFRAAEPFLPNDKPGEQVHRAYRRLRAHQMRAGWSRVRRAYYGQANEPTYLALKVQAELVGLLDREDHTARLRDTIEALRATDPEFHAEHIKALEWAIAQLSSRL